MIKLVSLYIILFKVTVSKNLLMALREDLIVSRLERQREYEVSKAKESQVFFSINIMYQTG